MLLHSSKYVFPNIHGRYTWEEIKSWQSLISSQVYRPCIFGKIYFNKTQKHNFGQTNAEIQAKIDLFSGTNELRALQQSCYLAHPENLLLAMLEDEDKILRAKAVNDKK